MLANDMRLSFVKFTSIFAKGELSCNSIVESENYILTKAV